VCLVVCVCVCACVCVCVCVCVCTRKGVNNHSHNAALHARPPFGSAKLFQVILQFLHSCLSQLAMRHFASLKADRGLDFVALC